MQGLVEGWDVQGSPVAAVGVHDAPVHADRQRAMLPIQQLLGEEEPPSVRGRREGETAVQCHQEVAGGQAGAGHHVGGEPEAQHAGEKQPLLGERSTQPKGGISLGTFRG